MILNISDCSRPWEYMDAQGQWQSLNRNQDCSADSQYQSREDAEDVLARFNMVTDEDIVLCQFIERQEDGARLFALVE